MARTLLLGRLACSTWRRRRCVHCSCRAPSRSVSGCWRKAARARSKAGSTRAGSSLAPSSSALTASAALMRCSAVVGLALQLGQIAIDGGELALDLGDARLDGIEALLRVLGALLLDLVLVLQGARARPCAGDRPDPCPASACLRRRGPRPCPPRAWRRSPWPWRRARVWCWPYSAASAGPLGLEPRQLLRRATPSCRQGRPARSARWRCAPAAGRWRGGAPPSSARSISRSRPARPARPGARLASCLS